MELLLVLAVWGIFWGAATAAVVDSRGGQELLGALLGAVLGPDAFIPRSTPPWPPRWRAGPSMLPRSRISSTSARAPAANPRRLPSSCPPIPASATCASLRTRWPPSRVAEARKTPKTSPPA